MNNKYLLYASSEYISYCIEYVDKKEISGYNTIQFKDYPDHSA